MRARLLTFFVAVAAIVGLSLTTTATAGAAPGAPAPATVSAAASSDFIHIYLYRHDGVYFVSDAPASGHGLQVGGFQLTTGRYLVVCDDYSDGIYIGGLLTINGGQPHKLVDTNGSSSGCTHTTIPAVPSGAWIKMTIYTGTTANPTTPRGGYGAAW